MRTQILLLSILLISISSISAENLESSSKNNIASTQQCGQSQKTAGPRHHRARQNCTQEKSQLTSHAESSVSAK